MKTRDVLAFVALAAVTAWVVLGPPTDPAQAESPKSQYPRAIQTGYYGAPAGECPEVGDGTCIPLGIGDPAAALVSVFFEIPDTRGSFRVALGEGSAPDFSAELGCTNDPTDTEGRCVSIIACNKSASAYVLATVEGWGGVLLGPAGSTDSCFDTSTIAPYVQGDIQFDNSTGCTTFQDCGGETADIALYGVDNG